MELLYFSASYQLEYVLAGKQEMLERSFPITSDMGVAFDLERLGINFIDVWGFLEPDEIRNNLGKARILSLNWLTDQFSSENIGDLNLCEVAKMELVWPFEACLNANTAYGKLFDHYPVRKISGFFNPPVAVIRTGPPPGSSAVCSVAEAVLFYMANKKGISVDKLDLDAALSYETEKLWPMQ